MLHIGNSSQKIDNHTILFSVESKGAQLALFEEIYQNTFIERIKKEYESLVSDSERLKFVTSVEVQISGVYVSDITYCFRFRVDELAVFFNDIYLLNSITSLPGHEFRTQVVEAYALSSYHGLKRIEVSIEKLYYYINCVKKIENKFLCDRNIIIVFNLVASVNCLSANQCNDFSIDFKERNLICLKQTLSLMYDTGWRMSVNLEPIERLDYERSVFYILSAYLPVEVVYNCLEREFSEPLRGGWFSGLKTVSGESSLYALMNSYYRQGIQGALSDRKYVKFLQLVLLLLRHGANFFENESILLSMIPVDLPVDNKISFLFDCRDARNENEDLPSVSQFYEMLELLNSFNCGKLADFSEVYSLIDKSVSLLDSNQLSFLIELVYEIYLEKLLSKSKDVLVLENATNIICSFLGKVNETAISTFGLVSLCRMFYFPPTEVPRQILEMSDRENFKRISTIVQSLVSKVSNGDIQNVINEYRNQVEKYWYCSVVDIHRYMLSHGRSVYSVFDFLQIRRYLKASIVFDSLKRLKDPLSDSVQIGFSSNRGTGLFQAIQGNLFLSALFNHDLDSAYDFLGMGISDVEFQEDASWSDSCFDKFTLASSLISVFFSLLRKQNKVGLTKLSKFVIYFVNEETIPLEEILSLLDIQYFHKSLSMDCPDNSNSYGRQYLNLVFAFFSTISSLFVIKNELEGITLYHELAGRTLLPYIEYSRKIKYLETSGEGSKKAALLCELISRVYPRNFMNRSLNDTSFAYYLLENLLNKKIVPAAGFKGCLIEAFIDLIENLKREEFDALLNESHDGVSFKQIIFSQDFKDLLLELIRISVAPSGIYEEDLPGYVLDYLISNKSLAKDILCDIAFNYMTKLKISCKQSEFKNEASFTQLLNVIKKVIRAIEEDKEDLFEDELIEAIQDSLRNYPAIKRALPSKGKSKGQFETVRLGPKFLSLFNEFLEHVVFSRNNDVSVVSDFKVDSAHFENREEAPVVPVALSMLSALPPSNIHAGSAVSAASSDLSTGIDSRAHKVELPRVVSVARNRRIFDIDFMKSADLSDVIRLIRDASSEEDLYNMPLRESIKLLNVLVRRKDLSEKLGEKEVRKLVYSLLNEEKISEDEFPESFRCEWSGQSKISFDKYYDLAKKNHEKRFPKKMTENKRIASPQEETKPEHQSCVRNDTPMSLSSSQSSSSSTSATLIAEALNTTDTATVTMNFSEQASVKSMMSRWRRKMNHEPSLMQAAASSIQPAASSSAGNSDLISLDEERVANPLSVRVSLRDRVRAAAMKLHPRDSIFSLPPQTLHQGAPQILPPTVSAAATSGCVNSGSEVVDSVLANLDL